jgi:hypothetical protein
MAAGFLSLALQETVIAFGGEGQANGIFLVAVAVLGKDKAHKGGLKGDAGTIRCDSDVAIMDNELAIVEVHGFRSSFPAGIAIVVLVVYIENIHNAKITAIVQDFANPFGV